MNELEQSKTKISSVNLTRRQKQCLLLVSEGFSSKEIGPRLGIHYKTVDNHIDFALTKLGMTDRREAGRWIKSKTKTNEIEPEEAISEQSPREPEYLVSHSDLAEPDVSEKSRLKTSDIGLNKACPLNHSYENLSGHNRFVVGSKADEISLKFFRFMQPTRSIEELDWIQRTTIILRVMSVAGVAMAAVILLFAGSLEILQRST